MTEVELVLGGVHHWQHLEENHLHLHAMLQNLLHQCSHHHWTQSHFRFQSQCQRIWPLSENNKINEHTVHTTLCTLELYNVILWVQHSRKTLLTGLQIFFPLKGHTCTVCPAKTPAWLEKTNSGQISAKKVRNSIFKKFPSYTVLHVLPCFSSHFYNL